MCFLLQIKIYFNKFNKLYNKLNINILIYFENKTLLIFRFEDGTVSFLSILALRHCFESLNTLIPKVINNDLMETVAYHTFYLAKDLYNQLKALQHSNGKKAVILYTDSEFEDIDKQGGMVAFNLLRADESYIGFAEVCL